jgi:MFS family permease
MTKRVRLPRAVLVLGSVSMFNDAASEMVAPLLPLLLAGALGAGPAIVAFIDGVAEATAGVTKLLAGRAMDVSRRPKALVLAGYVLSNAVRPFMAVAASWIAVAGLRFADRIGKGIRTAPRDALIAGAVDCADAGRAFGLHRSMDHLGAVIGPLAAFALLSAGLQITEVIWVSVIPGLIVVALIVLGVPADAPVAPKAVPALRWSLLTPKLRRLVPILALFPLSAPADALWILWIAATGVSAPMIALLWAAASVFRTLVAYPAGALSDRVGRERLFAIGLAGRVVVVGVAAILPDSVAAAVLAYFAFAAVTTISEPAERALVSDSAAPEIRGSVFGIYHMSASLAALPCVAIIGVLWEVFDRSVAFGVSALMGTVLGGLVVATVRSERRS